MSGGLSAPRQRERHATAEAATWERGATARAVTCEGNATAEGAGSKRGRIVLLVARLVLAVFFAGSAVPKFTGAHGAVQMFSQIGAGQWLRYFVGGAEATGAISLLVPALSGLAAIGLAADMAGASIINVAILHSGAAGITVVLCIGFAVIAWFSRPILGRVRPRSSAQPQAGDQRGNQPAVVSTYPRA